MKRGRTAATGLLAATGLMTGIALGVLAGCAASGTSRGAPTWTASTQEGKPAGERRALKVCTRYASPTGSDANRGTKRYPFKTAQRLADSLRAGETGCLRGGVYEAPGDDVVLNIERGGTPEHRLRIRSYPGERARLRGIVWIQNGADHVVLSHLSVKGPANTISVKVYADDVIIVRNNFTNGRLGKSCLMLGGSASDDVSHRPVVRRNLFHDCGSPEDDNLGHGIYAQNVVGGQITRNIFWSIQAYALQFYPNAQRTRFAHNIVDGGPPSVRGGVVFGGDEEYASNGNIVARNVIAYAATYNVDSTWDNVVGRDNLVRTNCLWGGREGNISRSEGGFVATGNAIARPIFANRAARDYRLKPGSRCERIVNP
jgi:hypothetical protein